MADTKSLTPQEEFARKNGCESGVIRRIVGYTSEGVQYDIRTEFTDRFYGENDERVWQAVFDTIVEKAFAGTKVSPKLTKLEVLGDYGFVIRIIRQ